MLTINLTNYIYTSIYYLNPFICTIKTWKLWPITANNLVIVLILRFSQDNRIYVLFINPFIRWNRNIVFLIWYGPLLRHLNCILGNSFQIESEAMNFVVADQEVFFFLIHPPNPTYVLRITASLVKVNGKRKNMFRCFQAFLKINITNLISPPNIHWKQLK